MRIHFKSPGGGGWFALHVSECVSNVAEADPILSLVPNYRCIRFEGYSENDFTEKVLYSKALILRK